jgi:urease alpha subunit
MLATNPGNRPSEAITREQAVTAYTLTSAYAELQEKEKGTIEAGKLADIAVLSQDIFAVPAQELPKTVSVLTLVAGKLYTRRKRQKSTEEPLEWVLRSGTAACCINSCSAPSKLTTRLPPIQ